MSYQLHFTVDYLPTSLNKTLRSNRWKLHKANKHWDVMIMNIVAERLPPVPLTKARLRITRHSYRMLDYDGLVGSLKPVVDALVTAGVLIDDSWGVLGAWDVYQVFRSKKHGSLLEIDIISL